MGATRRSPFAVFRAAATVALALCLMGAGPARRADAADPALEGRLRQAIEGLSGLGDRSPGAEGNRIAAARIREALSAMGHDTVGSFRFALPYRRHEASALRVTGAGEMPLRPFLGNAVSPGTLPPEGVTGPVVYAGDGRPLRYEGLPVEGAIVFLDMNSGKNWTHAANLGAAAVVYLDRGPVGKTWFEEKRELTPIRVPRLWASREVFRTLFPLPEANRPALLAERATLFSSIRWDETEVENVYCLVPGTDESLSEEILLVEAFYDTGAFVPGAAPGADEASGVAALLELAGHLGREPPARSVLLVATGARSQGLAGMRETMWLLKARSKDLKIAERRLKHEISRFRRILSGLDPGALFTDAPEPALVDAVVDDIKSEVDEVSRELMRLRMRQDADTAALAALAAERRVLRSLSWRTGFASATAEEREILLRTVPATRERHQRMLEDAQRASDRLEEARRFRSLARGGELAAALSLHLSSHGSGIGAFNQGWLHDLKPDVNRAPAYALLTQVLDGAANRVASRLDRPDLYRDTLRPSRLRPWESYLPDRPELGGEISALAGVHGLTLVTVVDARPFWGTPYDVPDGVDFAGLAEQTRFVGGLVSELAAAPRLHEEVFPLDGLSSVTGRANFLRHGELFADQPAPGTIVMAFQGRAIHYAMVDQLGRFQFNGVTDKKHQLHKVILEAYRFDPETGRTLWAVDKEQTGKNAYRVKMQRRAMETDLVMFACRESTLFHLLEPRTFRYMTQLNLLDARREATPLRYWWSRIDTRESTLDTLYLDPGTRYKLTLSDNIFRRKLILTGATERRPEGIGYRVDDWPVLYHTEFRTARDMWALLAPRIQSLERHGIHDERLSRLQREGSGALADAAEALEGRRYERFLAESARSWALAVRVYDQVEKTQKDVLFGVLFYIALFVPFAYCAERLLFSFRNIHKRIASFLAILLLLIAAIYQVHPAFELAYSPTVVILAFFIMGLSLIVTLIIFFRFEAEMVLLQRRASGAGGEEISRWKAFVAAFFLGVSNLRRRRVRTALTCVTLVILTFTLMSFTSVKSGRHQTRVQYQAVAPYRGMLFKTANWQDLPREAFDQVAASLGPSVDVVPRAWLETPERTRAPHIRLESGDRRFEARGLVGLSPTDVRRAGLERLLTAGRWFQDEHRAVVISDRAAAALGVDLRRPGTAVVRIWGIPHRVSGIFDSDRMQDHVDLDGEPLTPVTFPNEVLSQLTEVEFDAMESGEEVKSFQSRYQHTSADVTVFMHYRPVLAAGGFLKSMAAFLPEGADPKAIAADMVERFGLVLFSGEPDGTFVYQSSDTVRYQGLPNVFIPMVISVLIVLNTMIGSVYERKNEIGIYTSVGLAPSHVSFLFIAEALAFAVLSVVLGYLLAQGTAHFFSDTRLWSGITVNYSSMAGVGAMLLVIVVVLVSVTYPSRVAARIAIPDINRSWRLPDHRTSTMHFRLPFMVLRSELDSAAGYLLEHFESHQDVSHGLFAAGDISVAAGDGAGPGGPRQPQAAGPRDLVAIVARVWLAPFDFGVMQRVAVRFLPADTGDERFLAIELEIVRQAGEAVTWGRVNRQFVNALRKQLLIWRSLDPASAAGYGRRLQAALARPQGTTAAI